MTQSLVDCIGSTFILAYKENTQRLANFLNQAGCQVEVLRQLHRSDYNNYSRSYLCLLNHRTAWERALLSTKPTLIVEADFVPVTNFSQLPPPYDPLDSRLGIAWLYGCAAQIYRITDNGYAQGYSTAMVAYVVTQESAWQLIELAEKVRTTAGPETYTPWDSGIEYYLRDLHLFVCISVHSVVIVCICTYLYVFACICAYLHLFACICMCIDPCICMYISWDIP